VSRVIERAGEGDRSSIERLLSDSGLPTEDLDGAWHESFLVAREGMTIVGAVGLEAHDETGMLRSLATAASRRGRGVASALLERVERRAARLGVTTIYALTVTAESFLAKRGYEPIVRTEAPDAIRGTAEFRALCPDSAVCLRKRVTTRPTG
jgi:amino-acid N-acetyltransferase